MMVKSPLRLKRLQDAHAMKDSHGVVIPLSFDGIAMFLAEETEAKNGEVSDYDEKRFHHAHEKLRDNPCKANTSPQSFSDRINLFTTHVNPYMGDTELKGERLGKYILSQLPEDLGSDVRTLRRELEKSNELSDPTIVAKRAMELVEDAHKPDKTSPVDVGVHLVAACFGATVKFKNFDTCGERAEPDASAAAAAAVTAEVKRLLAVADTTMGSQLSGKAKKKAAKKAAAALAAAEADKPAKLKGGFRLPAGKRCSKGTCDYAHDERYPGEPCYRDPDWGGPLPLHVHNNDAQRMRIVAAHAHQGNGSPGCTL